MVDAAKIARRSAKATFTRYANCIRELLKNDSVNDVRIYYNKFEESYTALVEKQDNYASLLDDDAFEKEELLFNDCVQTHLSITTTVNAYLLKCSNDSVDPSEKMKCDDTSSSKRDTSVLKMEKPKLPKFNGDIRDYFIFKEDFRHMVKDKYTDRDSMTLLRTCLTGKPLELIKGIGHDYTGAWDYLDTIYGDPRCVADAVCQDVSKFKPIRDNEDHRFCDLVQLIHRSYNTLKAVDRPNDMNNNHMIALIEQKLCIEDRKVWARELEHNNKSPTFEDLLSWLMTEMKARMRATASIRTTNVNKISVNQLSSTSSYQYTKYYKCWLCNTDEHYTDKCTKFIELPVDKRIECAKKNYACFSCLKKASKNHKSANCNNKVQCKEMYNGAQCKLFHHHLFHRPPVGTLVTAAVSNSCPAVMPIIKVEVIKHDFKCVDANLLFDSASHISLITNSLVKKLKLHGMPVKVNISKVGGDEEMLETFLYSISIKSLVDGSVHKVTVIGIPHITESTSVFEKQLICSKFDILPHDLLMGTGEVDLLIGVDNSFLHSGEIRYRDDVIARKSPLGWVIMGGSSTNHNVVNTIFNITLKDISEFWTTESMGVYKPECSCNLNDMRTNELIEYQKMENMCIKSGNKWVMSYPWKKVDIDIPDNRSQAMKRLIQLENGLLKNSQHAMNYDEQIREMEMNGFCRKLTSEEINMYQGPVHYISHHAVLTPQKKSTPLRIVFNSSSIYDGFCLNDCWLKGPNLFNNLCGVLIRFRENVYAICADISKMYHRIGIPERDQHVHRFLWRGLEINRPPDTYMKQVLTFGDKPAPAMAQIALKKTVNEHIDSFPKVARIICNNAYMDDICESVDSKDEAVSLMDNMDYVLKSGGFTVKEWLSNIFVYDVSIINKVLGIMWSIADDKLYINYDCELIDKLLSIKPVKLCKRLILSVISKIFDPLGLVTPVVIRAKMGIQELWLSSVGWDDSLSHDIVQFWIDFFMELRNLKFIKFDRVTKPLNCIGKPYLCIFSDASEKAFGACSYVRWGLSDNSYSVSLMLSKSRVAPLKPLSIPRLELQAAVMAARLCKILQQECRYNFEKIIFFTDSMIVLSWISSPARSLKPFVSARVAEIQSVCDPSQWRHIASSLNIADIISRGTSVDNLQGQWSCGPKFLYDAEEFWPLSKADIPVIEVNKERRKVVNISTMSYIEPLLDYKRFSSWKRLVRTVAYVFKFVELLIRKKQKLSVDTNVSVALIEKAEMFLIKLAQESMWKKYENNEFKSLSPFIDENNIIRVGGRLKNTDFAYDRIHPILLPYKHVISYLIVKNVHNVGHYGVATTSAKTRKLFWIIRVHDISKMVKNQCVFCKKFYAVTESQYMADLPNYRVQPFTPAFHACSCDYFGPYKIKVLRNRTDKYYGVIFTCLNSRAVHLELATDCSTTEFLNVLRRFFSLRGFPVIILSDNGTQFVGAEKELRMMIEGFDKKKLYEFCVSNKVEWKFTTPAAPHHNGVTEALVKSVKYSIKKAIGDQLLKPFELYTVMQEVGNIVNERPIGRLPNDPDDGSFLCPNDLLLGRASSRIPHGPYEVTKSVYKRFEFIQNIISSFWKKWARDVFPSLLPRKKWHTSKRNVKINDIVVLMDNNALRSQWTVGRILDVFPGLDSLVRSVKIKTNSGEYLRPITKIVVIYPAEGYDNDVCGPEDVEPVAT